MTVAKDEGGETEVTCGASVMGLFDVLMDELSCSVCRDILREDGGGPCALGCGHMFCRECILEALRFRPRCPLCKEPSSKRGLWPQVRAPNVAALGIHARRLREILEKYPTPTATTQQRTLVGAVIDKHDSGSPVEAKDSGGDEGDIVEETVIEDECNETEACQGEVTCGFCHRRARDRGSPLEGPFSVGQKEIFVHRDCALWTPEVYETDTKVLCGVEKGARRASRLNCEICGITGAATGCGNMRCRKSYHYVCAVSAPVDKKPLLFPGSYALYCCDDHVPSELSGQVDSPRAPLGTQGHDDFCFVCHTGGTLLCCDTCTRAVHFKCNDPPIMRCPIGDWSCGECSAQQAVIVGEEGEEELESHITKGSVVSDQTPRRVRSTGRSKSSQCKSPRDTSPGSKGAKARTATESLLKIGTGEVSTKEEPVSLDKTPCRSPRSVGSRGDDSKKTRSTKRRTSEPEFKKGVDSDGKRPRRRSTQDDKNWGEKKVILPTGLEMWQRDILEQVARVRQAEIVSQYDRSVTHVVTNAMDPEAIPKRTVKYCMAVAAGCRIMCFGWILQTLENRRWAEEATFQSSFSRHLETRDKLPFEDLSFYLGSYHADTPSAEELKKLSGSAVVPSNLENRTRSPPSATLSSTNLAHTRPHPKL
eukprot:CAMPEP_0184683338 /NCGR_PEP_ID=MMETSP0312-20130426/10861_1 /TAXON_ID=31354 /ORGANISM="Compsopogon coeruleus, Strain SAG 36.94" /LENGTH=648 /DNA_ID=CAMNT_0027135613 /DNA_START=39 /DNA_END=1983 /DNA_ORIENTATION=-